MLLRQLLLFKECAYIYYGFQKIEQMCLICVSFKWKYIRIFAS